MKSMFICITYYFFGKLWLFLFFNIIAVETNWLQLRFIFICGVLFALCQTRRTLPPRLVDSLKPLLCEICPTQVFLHYREKMVVTVGLCRSYRAGMWQYSIKLVNEIGRDMGGGKCPNAKTLPSSACLSSSLNCAAKLLQRLTIAVGTMVVPADKNSHNNISFLSQKMLTITLPKTVFIWICAASAISGVPTDGTVLSFLVSCSGPRSHPQCKWSPRIPHHWFW